MSTLKTTNIQHPSAASPNLVLAADGSVSGGAGLGGLVHLHTESFTAQYSVSIDDVFDATYDNYRILIRHTGGNEDVLMRLRASGTPSTTNYSLQGTDANGTSISTNRTTPSGINTGINTNVGISDVLLTGPNLTAATAISVFCSSSYLGSFNRFGTTIHSLASSYDGFTFVPGGAGTISGIVSVYGYRKS